MTDRVPRRWSRQTDCSKAGSFQTWWVKRLDGRPGQIVPLDKVELGDLESYGHATVLRRRSAVK